jgi:hypothetical protein
MFCNAPARGQPARDEIYIQITTQSNKNQQEIHVIILLPHGQASSTENRLQMYRDAWGQDSPAAPDRDRIADEHRACHCRTKGRASPVVTALAAAALPCTALEPDICCAAAGAIDRPGTLSLVR